jgi:hypothetical protein
MAFADEVPICKSSLMLFIPIGVSSSRSDLFYPSHAWPLALLETLLFVIRLATTNGSCSLPLHGLPRLALAEHSPDRPGKLVGYGRNRHAVGPALEQFSQPWPLLSAFRPYYRSSPMHQQGPQVSVVFQ